MAAGPWQVYNDFKASVYKKRMDLNGGDTIKVALVTSASNAIDVALVSALYANITHELAAANGYPTGGGTAASPTISGGGLVATASFAANDVTITASGAGFTARAAVAYDVTSDDLIAYMLLDSTNVDVTVASGITLRLPIPIMFGDT